MIVVLDAVQPDEEPVVAHVTAPPDTEHGEDAGNVKAPAASEMTTLAVLGETYAGLRPTVDVPRGIVKTKLAGACPAVAIEVPGRGEDDPPPPPQPASTMRRAEQRTAIGRIFMLVPRLYNDLNDLHRGRGPKRDRCGTRDTGPNEKRSARTVDTRNRRV